MLQNPCALIIPHFSCHLSTFTHFISWKMTTWDEPPSPTPSLSLSLPPTLEPTLSYFPLYVCLLCNCNHWGSFRVCLFTLLGSLITLGNLIFLRLSSDMLYTTLTLNCVPLFQNLDTKLRRWNLHFTVSHISQNSTDTVYLPKPFSYQFSSPR